MRLWRKKKKRKPTPTPGRGGAKKDPDAWKKPPPARMALPGASSIAYSRVSAREMEVLVLVAEGLTNAEIGERLWLTEETIKSHVRHLLQKVGARNRTHLVGIAYREGWLSTTSRVESSGPSRGSPPPSGAGWRT